MKLGLKLMSHRLCCFNKNKLTIQSFRWVEMEEELIKDNVIFLKVIKVFESTTLKFYNLFFIFLLCFNSNLNKES